VNYNGNISDSERGDSQGEDSASESSKKAGIERKMTNNKSTEPLEKSKNIKKNCESAKMSRQRKKVYLDLLEQKAQELKTDIHARKLSIRQMNERILSKFQRSNRDVPAHTPRNTASSSANSLSVASFSPFPTPPIPPESPKGMRRYRRALRPRPSRRP
jgi:hypothetical protein